MNLTVEVFNRPHSNDKRVEICSGTIFCSSHIISNLDQCPFGACIDVLVHEHCIKMSKEMECSWTGYDQ